MGVLTFDTLLRSVKKGAPDPAYYLYGDEDVLKDEAVRALCEAVFGAAPASRDFNFDQRAAGDLDPEALHALLNTPPLLHDRRVVVLRGVEDLRRRPKTRAELVRYLQRPSPDAIVALVQGAGEEPDEDLVPLTTPVTIPRLPPERVMRWVEHHARGLGLSLEADAVSFLVRAVGDDLALLASELGKLAGLGTGEAVGQDAIAALVGIRHGETVDDLVRAIMERDTARAASLVTRVLEQPGVSGVKALTALGTELLGVALARAELDGGLPRPRLASTLYDHLNRARPRVGRAWKQAIADWSGWAQCWTGAELSRSLRLALQADRALKSSTVTDDRGLLLQLVLTLGVPAREAA
jgi:DNA polymerase-3 subunit delta